MLNIFCPTETDPEGAGSWGRLTKWFWFQEVLNSFSIPKLYIKLIRYNIVKYLFLPFCFVSIFSFLRLYICHCTWCFLLPSLAAHWFFLFCCYAVFIINFLLFIKVTLNWTISGCVVESCVLSIIVSSNSKSWRKNTIKKI